jgi:hypothetical protein
MHPNTRLRITPDELKSLYIDKDMSCYDIARSLGVHVVTVQRHLRRLQLTSSELMDGKELRGNHLGRSYAMRSIASAGPMTVDLVREWYLERGITSRTIADALGLPDSEVLEFIRTNAIWRGYEELYANGVPSSNRKKVRNRSYIFIGVQGHPVSGRDGYVQEHRLVMEYAIGRFLEPGEQVHHLDFDKSHNWIENLALFASDAEHTRFHHHLSRVGAYVCGASMPAPEPFFFERPSFYAGRWITQIDFAGGTSIPMAA